MNILKYLFRLVNKNCWKHFNSHYKQNKESMIIVVFFLITSVLCFENYTARLNDSQLYVLHRVYINQTDGTCQPIE